MQHFHNQSVQKFLISITLSLLLKELDKTQEIKKDTLPTLKNYTIHKVTYYILNPKMPLICRPDIDQITSLREK